MISSSPMTLRMATRLVVGLLAFILLAAGWHVAEGSPPPGRALETPGVAGDRTVAAGSSFTVTSTGDESDNNPGDGVCRSRAGECTLRAAIEEANALPGHEWIRFNVLEEDGTCPERVLIEPESTLHVGDVPGDGLTIDGYTQCGASPNSESLNGNAQIRVEVRGKRGGPDSFPGIQINSPRNRLRGLAIYNFSAQLRLIGGATHNRIEGNFIGTDSANLFTMSEQGESYGEGIHMRYGAAYNVIGCGYYGGANTFVPCESHEEMIAARNIISGNGGDGIRLEGTTDYNRIVGNYIGLKQDGMSALGNMADGIDLNDGPAHNWIGGTRDGEGNVISSNASDGVELSHNTRTTGNHITGNYIGTDATGMRALGNRNNGITLEDAPRENYIYSNVVSGNLGSGIRLYVLINETLILNNLIGTGADGETPLGNGSNPLSTSGRSGIYGTGGSTHNLICGNAIAFNGEEGIQLSNWSDAAHDSYGESYFNTISQNSIYANERWGIYLRSNVNPTNGETTTANRGLEPPILAVARPGRVQGIACARCRVEFFIAEPDNIAKPGGVVAGEGKRLAGAGSADERGFFSLPLSGVGAGQQLTATSTDPEGNTSEFAANIIVRGAPPFPVPPVAVEHSLWLPIVAGMSSGPPAPPRCAIPGF